MGAVERALGYPVEPLADGVVRLRRWEHRDIECVRLAATDERIPRGTTVPAVFSPPGGIAFIERQWGRQTDGEGLSLAIEPAGVGEAVGLLTALFRAEPSVVGLGYWVVPTQRGHGYAGRAVTLLTTWLLQETATDRVEALVAADNGPSRRTLERCGFHEEAHRRAHPDHDDDLVVYSLRPRDIAGG